MVDLEIENFTMEDKCFDCGRVQEIEEEFYYYEPEGIDGHITFCKKCHAERIKQREDKN